jgi:matrixin
MTVIMRARFPPSNAGFKPKPPAWLRAKFATTELYCAIALLMGGLACRADAYAVEGPRWPAGSVIIFQLGLGNANRTLIDGNTSWNTAAAPSLNSWNQKIQRARFNPVMNSSAPVSSGDHVNSIVFSTTIFGQSFGSGTLAVAYYRMQGSNMTEADVLFNRNQSFDSYRGALRFGSNGHAIGEIRRVLLHELGHVLGLGHPDQNGQHVDAVMNSMISNREALSSDDIAGGQALYGAPILPGPTPTPTPNATPSHVANISTRMSVGVNDDVLIGGFIVKGSPSQVKKLVLRAIGPSLTRAGISGAMRDPMIELHGPNGATIAANDNWAVSTQANEIAASGLAPSDLHESALVATLVPGSYTAIVRGVNNTTGVALIEGYEIDSTANRFANVSTRGRVGVGDRVLIGGLIVRGSQSKRVVLRALGPSLSRLGVAGALANPTLELHNSTGALIASNDNWQTSAQANQIRVSGLAPSNSFESAINATLPPGSYTAIVRGVNNATGVGIVEAYDLDP